MSSTRTIYIVGRDGEVAGTYVFVALFTTKEDAFAFAKYKQEQTKQIYSYDLRTFSEEEYNALLRRFPGFW
jgi:hypothetical protein